MLYSNNISEIQNKPKTFKNEKSVLSENLFDHIKGFKKGKNKHGLEEYILTVNDEKLTFDIIDKLRESNLNLRSTQVHSFVDKYDKILVTNITYRNDEFINALNSNNIPEII